MPIDLTGIPASRPAPLPAGAPTRPATPSTAVLPVPPLVETDTSSPRGDVPLGRSGLSALDVLFTTDLVAERPAVTPVALSVGLEAARQALLRRQPGEALRALDDIWPRAVFTEEGWYLRAGALTQGGLPLEADRLATAGLDQAPMSAALRFLQSIARTMVADDAGARVALREALAQHPEHPVLLAHGAYLLARQGRTREADQVLEALRLRFADHPATDWGDTLVRRARADAARTMSQMAARTSGGPFDVTSADATVTTRDTPRASLLDGVPQAGGDVEAHVAPPADGDPAEAAFARLGVRLGLMGSSDAMVETRALLRAFSTGGAFAGTILPEQAHGARSVLAAVVAALRGDGGGPRHDGREARSETRTGARGAPVISALVDAMRAGRPTDVARLLRRDGRTVPLLHRRWLEALVREVLRDHGAASAPPRAGSARADSTPERGTPVGGIVAEPMVHDALELGPDVPVRFGLGLLATRDPSPLGTPPLAPGSRNSVTPAGTSATPGADGPWGWATALGLETPPPPREEGLPALLPPLLAMTVAAAAGLNGATGVAIAAVVVAVGLWMTQDGLARPPRSGVPTKQGDPSAGTD